MADGRSTRGGVLETMEEFRRRREREIAHLGQQAEAAAHEAYRNAIRANHDLVLRTQAEVGRFGAALLDGGRPAQVAARAAGAQNAAARRPVAQPGRTAIPAKRSTVQQAVDQTLAAARGAQDAFTLGLGDRAYAGTRALMDAAHGSDFGEAWRSRMAAERARDAYDARSYRVARAVGEVAGTGLGLVALGPVDGLLAGGVRIAEATPMLAREAAVLGGVGAASGVAGQAATDVQRRHLGSLGDYAGAAIGGTAGALASARGRPGQAGAIGGATTSVAQDVLNGRSVDWEGAGQAALGGGYVAAPLGYAGRRYSDALPRDAKGKLGEALGRIRTYANFDKPDPTAPTRLRPVEGSKRYTVVDHTTEGGLVTEQKFGRSVRGLSEMQAAARRLLGDRYRVDHFLPRDVGALVAFPLGQFGYHETLADPD